MGAARVTKVLQKVTKWLQGQTPAVSLENGRTICPRYTIGMVCISRLRVAILFVDVCWDERGWVFREKNFFSFLNCLYVAIIPPKSIFIFGIREIHLIMYQFAIFLCEGYVRTVHGNSSIPPPNHSAKR